MDSNNNVSNNLPMPRKIRMQPTVAMRIILRFGTLAINKTLSRILKLKVPQARDMLVTIDLSHVVTMSILDVTST